MHDQIESGDRALVLSVRSANVIKHVGVETIDELVRFTEEEILEARCFGETTLREIRAALTRRGLRFGMTPAELLGRTGLDARIVAQSPTGANSGTGHEHEGEGPCCGHCDQTARKLRERTAARRG